MSHQHTYGNHLAATSIHTAGRNAVPPGSISFLERLGGTSLGRAFAARPGIMGQALVAPGAALVGSQVLYDTIGDSESMDYSDFQQNKRQKISHDVPKPPLVGVELNPGPGKGNKKLTKKEKAIAKDTAKAVVKAEHRMVPYSNPYGAPSIASLVKQVEKQRKQRQRKPKGPSGNVAKKADAESKHDSVELVQAREMYKHAIRHPWAKPIPPLGNSIERVVPLSGKRVSSDSVSFFGVGDALLFLLSPSFKAIVNVYISSGGSNFSSWGALDVSNLAGIANTCTTARIGLAALFMKYKNPPNGTAVAGSLWTTQLNSGVVTTSINPSTILSYPKTSVVKGHNCTIVLKPNKLATVQDWSTLPITTGATTQENYCAIMLISYSTTDRVEWGCVAQGEGLQSPSQALNYNLGSIPKVSYTPVHLLEGMPNDCIHYPRLPMMTALPSGTAEALNRESWEWEKKVAVVDEKSFPIHLNNGLDVLYTETELREQMKNAEFLTMLPLESLQWFKDNYGPEEKVPPVIVPTHIINVHHEVDDNKHFDSDDDSVIDRSNERPKISDSTINLAEALRGLVSKTVVSKSQ